MTQDDSGALDALTHRGDDGAVYRRSAAVDVQILAALALTPAALIDRAALGKDADGFLHEESLVYFMRAYRRRGDAAMVNALTEILLRRCTGYIRHWVSTGDADAVDDACGAVVERLIMPILDVESDRADYFQVRFWNALKRLAISTFRASVRERERADGTVPLGTTEDDAAPGMRADPPAPALSPQQLAEYREGLRTLKEPQCTAFLLRYYYNWPVEDRDPDVPTISGYFGKTSRTIRNWLAEADRTLAQWRGEQQ